MGRYVIRRILIMIPTLVLISLLLYLIMAFAPGDPLAKLAGTGNIPPEVMANIRKQFGLDKPWYIQYAKWAFALSKGDWGFSFAARMPVYDLVAQRIPKTLGVVGLAYFLAILIGIPIGILSAVKQYSFFDQASTTLVFMGMSIPSFFVGLLLILFFSIRLHWLPFIYDSTLEVKDFASLVQYLKMIIMPVAVIGIFETAYITRYVRSSILDNLSQDYVRTARSKGLSERVVLYRHVLRNSLIPVVTLVALGIPFIFTGAIIVEQIFRIQGIGELLVRSIMNSDTPVVTAITFTYAVLVVVFTLIADIVYGFLDPRIQYS
jgi:peptide/nickel transport system permease protein